jgi:2-iminoacetate synthase
MNSTLVNVKQWVENRVKPQEYERYLLPGGKDFVDDEAIANALATAKAPDNVRLKELLDKSMDVRDLDLMETAELLAVTDPQQRIQMGEAALAVKRKVYDKRIVTFAPLYLGNACVNGCRYCGFRSQNKGISRRVLGDKEIRSEVEVLAGKLGHKRIIAVYGEHPSTDATYIANSLKVIYDTQVEVNGHMTGIRRANVNAAPMSVEDLKKIHEAGIGTFQVFQETYHRQTYKEMHPYGPKSDFRWRLYALHRAMEAGIEDVGMGSLYGLADWRFEVLANVLHSQDLERVFGLGPHTISFPRMEPALDTPIASRPPHAVDDETYLRIITVLRLAVPYVGMICTARESAAVRTKALQLGITQVDASSNVGVGAYVAENGATDQEAERQQFMLGDTRTLAEVISELADSGSLTSFCTAGYRCGRTGKCIMDLLRKGMEGKFCKLNAVLTFREYIDDFGTPELKISGETLIQKEIKEIEEQIDPKMVETFKERYERTCRGERDLYF